MTELQPLASWVAALYTLVANLLFGVALLALFPRFSERAPVVGGLLNRLIFLLGLGALTVVRYQRRGRTGGTSEAEPPEESSTVSATHG